MYTPKYYNPAPVRHETLTADLCIYGGVSGGVIAAIEASKRGLSVILVEPSYHLGGLTSGGLGIADVGNKHIIGGLAREYFERVGRYYKAEVEWRFEPHIAEKVFREWLAETETRVFFGEFVEFVSVRDQKIESLKTISGLTVQAKMFIDASYEGDLMAKAGVSYCVGRECNSIYKETLSGAQILWGHQFDAPVDPYIVPGVPASGVLPGVDSNGKFEQGQGDHRVQSYNFRMCLTRRKDLHMPFPKPINYRPEWYILLKRYLATGWNEVFGKFDVIRNGKTDTNNHGAVSTDFIGMNHDYPTADYATRETIYQAHVSWQQGLMWTLANDPEVPQAIREAMSEWGLCRDEFQDSGGWPHALYIRESRRMISDYVMNENHCRGDIEAEDPAGMGAYGMDSHHCRRMIRNGLVVNEGDVQVGGFLPYPVSYRSLVPKRNECINLFVPFCLSSSHIGFGSIRMEPAFMVLSQTAAIAAAIAIDDEIPVQDVSYSYLRKELDQAGQILQRPIDVERFEVGVTEVDRCPEHEPQEEATAGSPSYK